MAESSERPVIKVNPKRAGISQKNWVDEDRYMTIMGLMSLGADYIRIEAEGSRLVFIFDKNEVDDKQQTLMRGVDFMVSWKNVVYAFNSWRDAYNALR